jgi:two-component system, OmpR family, sensor kinase
MTTTARLIARGDLSQRVRLPHGGDEIGQLAAAFDEMIGRIEQAFGAQTRSEARMRQFIADASHELRTPLTAIRGYSDVLLRGAAREDPAAVEHVLLAMSREAERMSRLVNDLLTLARLDEGRPLEQQSVDVIALVGEAVDQARVLAGDTEVSLTSDGGGRLTLSLDPDRIKQVLLVLLDNALKYRRRGLDAWVRVRVGRAEHGVTVSVADNGRGIAPEALPHIFDRFYREERIAGERRVAGAQVPTVIPEPPDVVNTATAPASGSGLGLAIATAIAQAHGGTLTVQSTLGVGTTFTLALPRD